jgi:hypothetical protein
MNNPPMQAMMDKSIQDWKDCEKEGKKNTSKTTQRS